MQFKPIALFGSLLLLAASLSATAQSSFTLQEAVDYAMRNNVKAKNANIDDKIAQAKVREITTIGFPKVNASYGINNNYIIQKVIIPDGAVFGGPPGQPLALEFQPQYGGNAVLSVNQLLFDGSYIVGLQAARVYRELSAKSNEMTQVEVAENVKKAYYGVLVNQERMLLLDASMKSIDSTLSELKALYSRGFIEKIDVDRLQVQRNNLAIERDKFSRFQEIFVNLLKFQMGYDMNQPIELRENLRNVRFEENVLEMSNVNPLDRPEMKLLQTQKSATKLEIRNIQAGYLPSIGLQLQRGALAGANDFNRVLDPNGSWFAYGSIGMGINWSLFDSFTKRYRVQQKQLELQKVENTIYDFRNAINLQASQAQITLKSSYESMKNQEMTLKLSEEVLNVARKKYAAGVGSSLEVINAESEFRQAQANYYNAVYDLLIAKVDLQKAKGQLLTK
ncbi:MAG: transporter [Sphingobacteriaceae bacterium]|nr:transporter [Sphingobacteriaceae bacterium]